ncbi:MAG: tRNA epoxyqueuosine(34) reductase QueG [Candidatus Binatia bacterium]
MKQPIRSAARRLGFELCGFAALGPPPHGDFVRRWLDAGNAAGMHYIERGVAKRLDPRLVMPDARSVITVGYRYLPPPVPAIDWREQLRGRIAAYALGPDYHTTVTERLRTLATEVAQLRHTAVSRVYVDTGPILEREWGAAGGIGWFGKNTNLLHTAYGSWFFLGEMLSNLEFTPEPALPDRCGTCTRCLTACPTEALAPGYILDARLCISYLTIEHRGALPPPLRPRIGNWIFGCDVCQEVCPWNERLARHDGAPDTQALQPYLPALLALSDDAFRARFRTTAIWRTHREGLARNVAVALGNTRNPAAAPALAAALHSDPSALVRGHAAWALGRIDDYAARRALHDARTQEPDGAVRREIDAAGHGEGAGRET